jgi:hypothetical protein
MLLLRALISPGSRCTLADVREIIRLLKVLTFKGLRAAHACMGALRSLARIQDMLSACDGSGKEQSR